MAKSVVVYHLVWCTFQRQPFITPDIERDVYRCLQGQARSLQCSVLALNGTPDHVHLVLRAPATLSPAQIMKQLKGVSATLIRKELRPDAFFSWRDSYFVYSLCDPVTAEVITYVKNQKRRHSTGKLWPSLEDTDDEPDNPDNPEPD